jgi:hypothetical protein
MPETFHGFQRGSHVLRNAGRVMRPACDKLRTRNRPPFIRAMHRQFEENHSDSDGTKCSVSGRLDAAFAQRVINADVCEFSSCIPINKTRILFTI